MLLTVDIGNTHITMGLIDAGFDVAGTFRITTKNQRTSDEYGVHLREFCRMNDVAVESIEDVIISSVVPKVMHSFTNAIRKYIHKEPLIVGAGLDTGVNIKTDFPREVGADKIVDAAAVYNLYGGNAIIIDMGTATTFDYIDDDGDFLYNVIMPGLEISAQALWQQAAKLPEIEIKKPPSVLGTNTDNSMRAGVVYGYIGSVEYIVNKMKAEIGKENIRVYATGGLGRVIFGETDAIDVYDPDLAFKGMKIIYDRYKKNNS